MKQIPLLQGKALLIELPEGAPTPYVINTGQPHLSYLDIDVDLPEVDLPPGNWRIIGMLSEVTEMDAIPLVDKECFIVDGPDLGFRNYKGNKYDWFGTALESLESAILAEGWLFESPPKPVFSAWELLSPVTDTDTPIKKWQAAQSCVLDRSRCLLLGREI